MKVQADIMYIESYLPTKRHRIPRLREVTETVEVELREVDKANAPLALVVRDYQSYLDENGANQFGPMDTECLAVDQQLYSRKKDMAGALVKGDYSLDRLLDDIKEYGVRRIFCVNDSDRTKEHVLKELQSFVDDHLLIGGEVYVQSGEPRYVIHTFGLGHNHGGTSLSITSRYNPNISKTRYFNALQREEALACAKNIALHRGDTDYVDGLGKNIDIKVLMPELIHCNPQMEHGDGSPLLNSLEDIVQASNSTFEAGLLVMGQTAANIQEGKNPSLDSKIQSAASKVENTHKANDSKEKELCEER